MRLIGRKGACWYIIFFLKQHRRLRSAHHCIKEGENKSVKTQAEKKKRTGKNKKHKQIPGVASKLNRTAQAITVTQKAA
jgi:hypothetical protein